MERLRTDFLALIGFKVEKGFEFILKNILSADKQTVGSTLREKRGLLTLATLNDAIGRRFHRDLEWFPV